MELQKKALEHAIKLIDYFETYDYQKAVVDRCLPADVIEKYPQLSEIITKSTNQFFQSKVTDKVSEAKGWLNTILKDLK